MFHQDDNENANNDTHTQAACADGCSSAVRAATEACDTGFKEKFLRAVADFENFKQRVEKERVQWGLEAKISLLKDILPIFDDLERAIANMPQEGLSDNVASWLAGIQGVVKNLQHTLQKINLQEIDCAVAFDPELHEALCQVPSDQVASGHVVEVLRKGYTLHGVVVRHAQVSVAQ